MKTLSFILKKGSAVLLLLAGLYSTSLAQGNHNRQGGDNSRHDGGGTRQSTFRDRVGHQPNGGTVNQQRPTLPARTQPNRNFRDNTRDRINTANNNRPTRTLGDIVNNNRRPPAVTQNNNNRGNNWNNNNRPGNNNNNRPGNNNNRPGNNNNRPGNGWNNHHSYPGGGGYYGGGHRPVYNAHNPNWRYSYLPRRHSVFNTLPSSYLSINFGGYGYRYYDGVFYRPYNNEFTVIAPPIGIHIGVLPIGYRRIYVNDYPYYYYNGTYYDYQDNDYVVVSPPVGAIVESIPDGYETVIVDGETYYTVDGAQYKPVVQDNGEIWYEVIKAN